MRRTFKIILGLVAVCAALGFGAHAVAQHHLRGLFAAHLKAKIAGALDAAHPSAEQRAIIEGAEGRVREAFHQAHASHAADLEQAIALFEADRIDPEKLAALRAGHQAQAQAVGDAVVRAVTDVHDTLTPAQRQAVVDYAKRELQAHGGQAGPPPFVQKVIDRRVEGVLDAIKATPAQRARIGALKSELVTAFEEARPEHRAELEKALALFAQDRLDPQAIEELRAAHQAQARAFGDTLVHVATELHDLLSAEQRQALAAFVRSHHHGIEHG
jgi:Spy/CpxP family protein refolding chaperone